MIELHLYLSAGISTIWLNSKAIGAIREFNGYSEVLLLVGTGLLYKVNESATEILKLYEQQR